MARTGLQVSLVSWLLTTFRRTMKVSRRASGTASADKQRHGHITKEGSCMARWLILQAALVNIRMAKQPARSHYLGVSKRRGKQIARVAATRKLVGVMYHLMREQIDYEEFLRRGGNAQ